ncbi:MAG: radical SAM protein [Candidatus Altiarchaeota archaeon]
MFNLKYEFFRLRDKLYSTYFFSSIEELGKVPPPAYVLWDATRRCNLNCLHCGATKESYEKELTTQEIKSVIDDLSDMGVTFFSVTGGEPFVRDDLLEVLSYASSKGLKTIIASNGFLIDEEKSREIKGANISSVMVSLDGIEQTHNRIRDHSNSYAKALDAIRFMIRDGIPLISVGTTVSPENINELDELKDIISSLGVKRWRLSVVMPIGRAESGKLSLKQKELKQFFDWIIKNKKGDIDLKIGENLTYLGAYEKRIRDNPLLCPVGFTACCIGTDGHVRGCPEQPDDHKFREGSLLEKSFPDIWGDGFRRYRERVVIEEDLRCRDCKDKASCRGGCYVMREGDIHCIHDLLSTNII